MITVVIIEKIEMEGLREFEGKVLSVAKNCNCELCEKAQRKARFKSKYPRWHMRVQPLNPEYNEFQIWIAADSAYAKDPSKAGEGTQLGDFIQRLVELGFNADTVDDVLIKIVGATFLWERAKIGRKRRETWLPKKVLANAEPQKPQAGPTEAKEVVLRLTPEEAEKIKRLLESFHQAC